MANKIWMHQPSGERYAVAVDSYGQIVGAAGPIHYSEVASVLVGDWDLNGETTEWVRDNSSNFRDVTEQARRDG